MKTKKLNRLFLYVFLGVAFTFFPEAKVNAGDLAEPQLAIESVSNQLKERLDGNAFTKDSAQLYDFVENVLTPHFDFNRISILALGKLWKKATKEEKLKFKTEFRTLLIRTYAHVFVDFGNWSIRFLPFKLKQGAKKVLVKTEVLQPDSPPLSVSYRMILSKGKWWVYDIIIEGVSLVTNYRRSFISQIKKAGSLTAVIEILTKKNSLAVVKKDSP